MLISLISIDRQTKKIDKESYDLSQFSIFTKGQVKSFLQFVCIEIAKEIANGNDIKQDLSNENNIKQDLSNGNNIKQDLSNENYSAESIGDINSSSKKTTLSNYATSQITEISQTHGNKLYRIIIKPTETNLYMLSCDDKDYPQSVINDILCRAAYTDDKYSDLLAKYQDWKKHDMVTLVKKELDETKKIMTKTLKDVIERGERIEQLERQSEELKINTERLFKKAKAQNKCCRLF